AARPAASGAPAALLHDQRRAVDRPAILMGVNTPGTHPSGRLLRPSGLLWAIAFQLGLLVVAVPAFPVKETLPPSSSLKSSLLSFLDPLLKLSCCSETRVRGSSQAVRISPPEKQRLKKELLRDLTHRYGELA